MESSIIGKYKLLVIHLSGELDHHRAQLIRENIDRELMRRGVRNLAMDFSGMGFMDSSGLGLVMGRYKKVAAIGGKLIVYGMNENIKKIFRMCGLQRAVIVAENLEKGMEELNQ